MDLFVMHLTNNDTECFVAWRQGEVDWEHPIVNMHIGATDTASLEKFSITRYYAFV